MAYEFNPFTGTLDKTGGAGGGGVVPDPLTLDELTVNTLLTADHIHGNIAGGVYIHVKNTDTFQLDAGTPFYITGTVGASDRVEVQAADSADPAKGPAVGVLETTLAVNGEGNGIILGEIFNYDTDTPGWSTNDSLYVANGSGLTNVKPTSGYRQIVAYVGRVHASTGTLVLTGTNIDPVAGSDTQIQFNDNGGFGGSPDLTWDDTAKELSVGGDINLDDGGTYSTTVQSVTPTANRTISFPDATGTVALVNGADGTIQYNNAGKLKGNSDFTVDLDWNDALTEFTGLKFNVTNTASASNSKLLDLQVGGTSQVYAFDYGSQVGLVFDNDTSNGFVGVTVNQFTFGSRESGLFSVGRRYSADDAILKASAAGGFGWSYTTGSTNTADLKLLRDAAGTLAQRNGTNAQTYRLYNTYTDASDYERTSITRDSSGLVIDAQKDGTGVDPTNLLDLQLGGSSKAKIDKLGINYGVASAITTYIGLGAPYGATTNFKLYGDTATLRFASNHIVGWTADAGNAFSALDTGLVRDSAGVVAITDGSTGTGYLRQVPIAVASLPTAAAGNAGTRIFVSDASVAAAGNFGSVVAGGGSNTVPVYSDGGAWRIG